MVNIRIGQTFFKNTDFIYYAIVNGIVKLDDSSFHTAHPPKLGEMLLNNEIDIGPIPSIIYGQNSKNLLILPDFSISGYGETKSILIFSENCTSLEDLKDKKLAVPSTSASSTILAQIILKIKGINAEIIYHSNPDIKSMLKKADAALLIGDHALIANYRKNKVLTDLGEEWKALTGNKMVYALWAIRKEFAEQHPEQLQMLYQKLCKSKKYAYENFDVISEKLSKGINISTNFMKEHLSKLDYGFDKENEKGLIKYFDCAKKFGFIKNNPKINF
ncbi:MAG: menaquinone biosynthesis protein, partial [Euryarchaeota archaeon]|nr:menaquinone biosynthesis protein [Euryarchaeota archaeon]